MKVEMQLTGQEKRSNVLINSSGRWITCLFFHPGNYELELVVPRK